MGRDYDARAATDMSAENLHQLLSGKIEYFEKKLVNFPGNREYLQFFIFALRNRNDKKNKIIYVERLKKRDDEMQWKELLHGSRSFKSSENLNSLLYK